MLASQGSLTIKDWWYTYVQFSLRVIEKKKIMTANVKTLGTTETRTRNLANSAEDQALSR